MSELYNLGAEVAQGVVNYATTFGKTVQHQAGRVYGAIKNDVGLVGQQGKAALLQGKQTLNEVSQQSIGGLAQSGKQRVQAAENYLVNTPFGQMADDVTGTVTNAQAYKVAAQKLGKARNYGNTVLSDLDAFYHNADGTYDRTKVGLTAAAGLGIAGIAGYNMNN